MSFIRDDDKPWVAAGVTMIVAVIAFMLYLASDFGAQP